MPGWVEPNLFKVLPKKVHKTIVFGFGTSWDGMILSLFYGWAILYGCLVNGMRWFFCFFLFGELVGGIIRDWLDGPAR